MGRRWTEHEVALASDPDLTVAEVAVSTGRTERAITVMRCRLRLGKWQPAGDTVGGHRLWTAEEDELLARAQHLSTEQVAKALGRTPLGVAMRRHNTGLLVGMRGRDRHEPWHVGTRRLLARTCVGCGLLLGAEWFGQHPKTGTNLSPVWRSKCRRCRDEARSPDALAKRKTWRPEYAKTRAFIETQQRLTLPYATRHGQEYTGADDRVLSNPHLSNTEKALLLHRTYNAVVSQVHRNGYRSSERGRSTPEDGQWTIRFPAA